MTPEKIFPEFKRNAVQPVECLKQGWDLIKDDYWVFFGISALALIIGSMGPLGILMGAMMCGLNLAFLRKTAGERVEFGTLFKGFDYFADGFIAALLHYLPMMVIIAPFYIIMMVAQFGMMASSRHGEPNPAAALGFLSVFAICFPIMMILMILLQVGFAFAYPLIVAQGLSGADAVKVSFKAAFANFWRLFGLLLLNGLLGFLGVICCYVGVLFILPITFAAMFIAYSQVFGTVPQHRSPYPPPPPSSFA
jgi:uncharacterized membrane protein